MPWLQEQLQALQRQRGHAWLLQGPSGLGQYDLAMQLASTWLCDNPTEQGACHECGSCHAIGVHAHADLAVLMPEVQMLEQGWPLSEKAQSEIDDKKRKASKEIRVDALRDTVEFAQRTSARGRGKVVLVYPAEQMNAIAANALLKTLEEPAGDTRFVLATESAHALLPTIRSRCQVHTMRWPETDEALHWLQNQGVQASEAAVLLRAAGGLPHEAWRYKQLGRTAQNWSAFPQQVLKGQLDDVRNWMASDVLDALYKLAHDLLALHGRASPRYFSAADLQGIPVHGARLRQWASELQQIWRHVEHPFHAGLMLEAWMEQARSALVLPLLGKKP
ncbi:DNA polymerase III subunit delta' [Curvibacter sp. CHRR-16]|uniref:DNA polymerase III subunit delta' n=1 Tax=Curvibacter sp. CHRR-16 TaxID=2835872 RepID=UPI002023B53D|nr:DNA polymerase III subunit delta' [Curvibacter sp. CHRR-16]